MSVQRKQIVKAIREFSFGNFGLDDLDELKADPSTSEWITSLADAIERELKS